LQIYTKDLKKNNQKSNFLNFNQNLLNWYDENQRQLPWRNTKNPYSVWVSEIILQQTQVIQGLDYYRKFMHNFPTLQALADANTDEVLLYWKGLGYYSRAINLHTAAKQVQNDHGGQFPQDFKSLQSLKGVGKYTAAAIASICFDEVVPAIDGNFYRVFSRLMADDFDISQSSAQQYFFDILMGIIDHKRPGDFNQAIMDLGATICKPKNPNCDLCPVQSHCLAFVGRNPENYPVKTKKTKQVPQDMSFYYFGNQTHFAIEQRDSLGIWKQLFQLPQTPLGFSDDDFSLKHECQHLLTHRKLQVKFYYKVLNDKALQALAKAHQLEILPLKNHHSKSFPKLIENFLDQLLQESDN
jgi:A/G-specific adenine glycosylase